MFALSNRNIKVLNQVNVTQTLKHTHARISSHLLSFQQTSHRLIALTLIISNSIHVSIAGFAIVVAISVIAVVVGLLLHEYTADRYRTDHDCGTNAILH